MYISFPKLYFRRVLSFKVEYFLFAGHFKPPCPTIKEDLRVMMHYYPDYKQYYYSQHKPQKQEFQHFEGDEQNKLSKHIRRVGKNNSIFR